MPVTMVFWKAGLVLAGTALVAMPALAGVREGVDAWSRGDYAAAVAEWEGPAAAGDADAIFNLAQAYRLGRGVPLDAPRAESLYARAAELGHVQAADTYGLMLFQDGRREPALPYVEAAARRGDPRAQYLLGIAHFNGDLVPRDWQRAYALLTLANAAGLPQAGPAISQMDEFIPLADRQQGAALAEQLRTEAIAAREVELAAADLSAPETPVPVSSPSAPTPRVPRPITTVAVSPSVAAAQQAVAEARRATGTESPADAGASFARPAPALASASAPSTPAPAPAVAAPAAAPAGDWRVQLGAFSVRANADRLWSQLSSRPELAGRSQLLVPAGRVTKLQAGGFASRADADAACRALRAGGHECLVTRD